MIVDSHCHLNMLDLKKYDGQLKNAIAASKQEGVEHLLCVSVQLSDYPIIKNISQQFPNVHISTGVHPNEQNDPDFSLQKLLTFGSDDKVIAIGETGLDYYRSTDHLDWQRQKFRTHIQAGLELNKPIIVHTRSAKEDTIRILEEENAKHVGGIMHCFTESLEMAHAAIENNFYISFSGVITFKNAFELRETVKHIPLNRILVETDSPYLAPVPYRGQPNEPAYVRFVVEKLAEILNLDYKTVAQKTTENYFRLFDGLISHEE